jgi:hypothetical protein
MSVNVSGSFITGFFAAVASHRVNASIFQIPLVRAKPLRRPGAASSFHDNSRE